MCKKNSNTNPIHGDIVAEAMKVRKHLGNVEKALRDIMSDCEGAPRYSKIVADYKASFPVDRQESVFNYLESKAEHE